MVLLIREDRHANPLNSVGAPLELLEVTHLCDGLAMLLFFFLMRESVGFGDGFILEEAWQLAALAWFRKP